MDGILGIAWENLIIGLLGGFIVSLIFYLLEFFKNRKIEKKYPIGGEYLSVFEDAVKEDDNSGSKTYQSAPVTLKQKGKNITGTTKMENGRTWNLNGAIDDTGKFYGLYTAEDPIDPGVGTFFLEI